jgi:hypothetical protein
MLSPVRLYVEGTLAVAIMATLAIIAGFAAAAITGDRTLVMLASAVVFLLAGLILAIRLRGLAREPALPVDLNS